MYLKPKISRHPVKQLKHNKTEGLYTLFLYIIRTYTLLLFLI